MNQLRPIKPGARTYNGRVIDAATAAEYARLTELANVAGKAGLKASRASIIDKRARLLRLLPMH